MTPAPRIVWYILTSVMVQLFVIAIRFSCGVDNWFQWARFLGVECLFEATSVSAGNAGAHISTSLILWYSVCLILLLLSWFLCLGCDLAITSILYRFTSRYFDRAAMASALIFTMMAFLCASRMSWQRSYDTAADEVAVGINGDFYVEISFESPSVSSMYAPLRWDKCTLLGFAYVFADNAGGKILVRRFYVPLWYVLFISGFITLIRFEKTRLAGSRNIRGLCVNCGYDLRETPLRCPECGAIPKLQTGEPSQRRLIPEQPSRLS